MKTIYFQVLLLQNSWHRASPKGMTKLAHFTFKTSVFSIRILLMCQGNLLVGTNHNVQSRQV